MKAVIHERYGSPDDLRVEDVDLPTIGDGEVLVRVRAASVNPDVWHVLAGFPYVLRLMGAGLRRPNCPVPGTDAAGIVESVGKNVTRLKPGDEVFGETVRGHQWHNGGAYAEYVAVREEALAIKPPNVTFEQAASVATSGLIAHRALRDEGQVQSARTALINGAGGGVGSIAVQLAKAYDTEVTGVDCVSKLHMIRSLGADHVIDYAQEDFTRSGKRYDLVFDVPGNHSFWACRRALTPEGRYVLIGHDHFGTAGRRVFGSVPRALGLLALSPFVRQLSGMQGPRGLGDHLARLREFLEAGKLTPVIDRTFSLDEVPEAIRYLRSGQAQGRIVISV